MHENDISYLIRQAAYQVHVALGPELLESAHEAVLMHEPRLTGLWVQSQVALPMMSKNVALAVGYRLDLLVEDKVIVELKATDPQIGASLAQRNSWPTMTWRLCLHCR